MKYIILWSLILLSLITYGQHLDNDSILNSKKSLFLDDLLKGKEYTYSILGSTNGLVKPKDAMHAAKPTLLIKSDSTVYLTFVGSGRMYKMTEKTDSGYIYKRIDNTQNINYNLAAYYFSYKGNIYCFGGYGFWKNNGVLKVFTESTHEWNVIPVNREVIPQNFPILNCWFSAAEEKLYVLFHCPTNAGIIGKQNLLGQIKNDVEALDLKTNTWQKIGETRKEIIDLLQSYSPQYQHTNGFYVLSYDKLLNIDIINNKVTQLKDNIAIQSLMRVAGDKNIGVSNNHVFYFDVSLNKYDSVFIDPKKFEPASFPVWENPISPYLMSVPVIVLVGVSWFLLRKKKRKGSTQQLEQKEKTYRIQFNDTELALVNLLMKKSVHNKTATIADINYVLGVKDKNTGLQKKVRSDVFNSINEKYKFFAGIDEPLIQSIRSEEDKRFLEYMILEERMSDLNTMLGKS